MVNIQQLMKQMQAMQQKMQENQNELANKEYTGQAGAGMVKITLNGKIEIIELNIDIDILKPEEKELIEDLIIAAFNDAKAKLDADSQGSLSNLLNTVNMPSGFKLPF